MCTEPKKGLLKQNPPSDTMLVVSLKYEKAQYLWTILSYSQDLDYHSFYVETFTQ